MKAFLVAVLTTRIALGAADGGVDAGTAGLFTADIYAVCPDAPPSEDVSGALLTFDGGVSRELDYGTLLFGPQRAKRTACLMATCDTARAGYKATLDGPSQPAWWVGWFGAGSLGIGVGLAVGLIWNAFAGGAK